MAGALLEGALLLEFLGLRPQLAPLVGLVPLLFLIARRPLLEFAGALLLALAGMGQPR